jgi:competence protein ComEC
MAFAFLINENYDALNALAVACIIILLVNPFCIDDAGFILTVSSTLGILLFYNNIYNYLKIKKQAAVFNIINYFLAILSLTLAATILVIPLNMLIFKGISTISPISNILVVPVVFIVFLLSALSVILSFFPPLGLFFAALLNLILDYINLIIASLSALKFSYINTNNGGYIVWIIYSIFAVIIIYTRKEKIKITPVILLMVLSFYCVHTYADASVYTDRQKNEMRVAILDVGQGQCIFVSTPNHNMMIDCGSISYNIKASEVAVDYLDKNNIDTIDVLFISHFHSDHVNGAAEVLKRKNVKNIVMPPIEDHNGTRDELLKICANSKINVIDIDGTYKITLSKDIDAYVYSSQINKNNTSDQNESNLVLYLKYKNSELFFTGDIDSAAEKILYQKEVIDADVLVVPHHGSKTSSTDKFLMAVSPQLSVISVGKDNDYGLPSQEVIHKLESLQSKIFRTDINKTILMDTAGDGIFRVQYNNNYN